MSGSIDTAYVTIEPDFHAFKSETDRGITAAFDDIDPSVRALINAIERQFEDMAASVVTQFEDMGRTADDAFLHMMEESTRAADTMADEFQRQGERAERALTELTEHANRDFGQISRNASEAGHGVGGMFSGMVGGTLLLGGITAAGAGLEQLTQFGLSSAASLEQTRIAFQSLTGSVDAGNKQFADLQQFAAVTPFTFKDLTTGAQRFDAFSKTIGMTQQQLIPFLTTIGNLVAVTGGGAQSLDSITLALGQTASQGKLTLGNLDQINNAIPGFSSVAALAAVRGQTTAQVMQEISAGSIDAKTGIAQLLQGMQQFPGAAGAMQKQSETLLGVWSTFTDTVSQSLSNAFTPVIPAIKDSLTQITPVIGQALTQVAPAIGGVLAQVLPLLASLVQAITPILTPILNALGQGLGQLGPALVPLGQALGSIAQALAPLLPMAAQLIAAIAQGLAPVIMALAPAVSALVGAIQPLIGPVSQILVMVGQTLAALIVPIAARFAEIMNGLGPILGQVVSALGTALAPLLQALAPLITQLLQATEPLIPALLQLLPPLVQIIVALTPLITLVAELLTVVVAIAAPILKLATSLTSWVIINAIVPVVRWLAQGLQWLLQWLVPVSRWIGEFASWINHLDWGKIGHAILGAFRDGWDAVIHFFSALPGQIGGFLSSLPGMLSRLVGEAFDAMTFAIGYGIGLMIKELIALPGQVAGFFEQMWHNAVQFVTAMVTDVIAFVEQLPQTVPAFIEMLWTRGKAIFLAGVNAIVSFAQSIPGRVASGLSGLWNAITGAIGDLFSKGSSIGHDLLMGLIHGIEGAVGAAIDASKRAVTSVINGAKSALGISSPSRVFAELGRYTVEGYAQGIDQHVSTATTSITNLLTPTRGTSPDATSGAGTTGIVFGPGAINVSLPAGATAAQAYQAGQQVGQGISDALSSQGRTLTLRPRTV